MGVEQFRKHIAEDVELARRFSCGVLDLLDQHRFSGGSEFIDSELLSSCVQMLLELGLYSNGFDQQSKESSRRYWSQVAEDESRKNNLKSYIDLCVRQEELERDRCEKFQLTAATKVGLLGVFEDEMIRKMTPLLTNTDQVTKFLRDADFDSLQKLCQLLEIVGDPGVMLKTIWTSYIITEGTKIVQDAGSVEMMVPRLLDLKGILRAIWSGPLKQNARLEYALRDSFWAFINEHSVAASLKAKSKPAEMVAKYVDMLLRKGAKGLPPVAGLPHTGTKDVDIALVYRLELVLDLFKSIQGKDVFEAFYKKDLSRRLLMGRSSSMDAERQMVAKLRTGRYRMLLQPNN